MRATLGELSTKVSVTRIEVTGMCCQSEVDLINKKIGALPGIQNIGINLMLRQIAVTHDEQTPPEHLVRTLNWALLGARLVDGESASFINRGGAKMNAALAITCGVLWGVSFGI